MASALQCPACGCKHRLSGLSGDPIFTCSQCGRLLKTPTEFRRPEPSGPGEAPRPSASTRVPRGGAAARDETAVLPGPRPAPARARRARPRPTTDMALPLRILAWVVAVGLGAVIVRWFARVTGWLTGDSVIDLITGSGVVRYLRVFTLVPVWALATAGLATLFIEGGRWLARRRAVATSGVPRASRPARPPARRPAPPRQATPRAAPKPPPPPPPAPAAAPPPAARQPAPKPAAAETRSPTGAAGAAGAPRPRRIPRRDVSS